MISTLNGYIASAKQKIALCKTASITTVAAIPFSIFNTAGNPGAGTLSAGNTANGVVPTDAVAGHPTINAFGVGNTGYISKVDFASSVAGRLTLYDRIFNCGAYAFNAATTLATQPAYSSRVPGGTDYCGLEIWFEAVTAYTTNTILAVTYTDQAGNTGHTTGAVAFGLAPTAGRMIQLPLAAGDCGVSKIESVTFTGATAGTGNVMVLRPLWTGRVMVANDGDVHDMLRTGLIQVFADSALFMAVTADSTSSGVFDCNIEVANG